MQNAHHISLFSRCRFTDGARLQIGGAGTRPRRLPADVQPDTGAGRLSAQVTAREQRTPQARRRRGHANTPARYQGTIPLDFYDYGVTL